MSDTTRSSDHSEISIIRSADGKMFKVTVPLSTTTLNALKDVIHTHPDLGPIQRKHQRLFHLGRELKSGNRSLKALGVGKFSVFLIHLHSLAPKTFDLQSDDDNDDYNYVRDDGIAADVGIGLKNGCEGEITNIDDDDDEDDVVEIDGGSTNANSHSELKRNTQYRSNEEEYGVNNAQTTTGSSINASRQSQQQGEKVVELLDSDNEEEGDDDVEIVETVPSSRSKRRKFH